MLKASNIEHYYSNVNDHHMMAMIERFNRTIRGLIEKYMTAYNTHKWVDVLQNLTENYNNTVHGTTGFKPNDVDKKELATIFQQKFDRVRDVNDSYERFKVGQKVRRWKNKSILQKKTGENFMKSVYVIEKVNNFSYKISNEDGIILKGTYKHYDLQPIDEVEEYDEKSKSFDREKKKKEYKVEKELKKEGIDQSNVVAQPRRREVRSKKEPQRLTY
jgi:hypothetical protein